MGEKLKRPKPELADMLEAIAEDVNSKPPNSVLRREILTKLNRVYINDLTEEQQLDVLDHFFIEMKYKSLIEHPEFMNKQFNNYSKVIFLFGVVTFMLIMFAGVMFSDSIASQILNQILSDLRYYSGGKQ